MLAAPIPADDKQRLGAMDARMCAFVPREERFDRITRLTRRLLDVPMALISIVDEDLQWFRSVQGLDVADTARDISFCGHAIASDKVLHVPDTLRDPRFRDNPLVTASPYIRAYLGVPLSIAPGVRAGTLCALSDKAHSFRRHDVEGLQDLAAIAESELRLGAMATVQKRLLTRLTKLERQASLDPVTGCWNVRGFRQLVNMAVEEAREKNTALALCCIRVRNFPQLAAGGHGRSADAVRQVLAQVLRQRLPAQGALGVLGQGDFCALVPGATSLEVESALGRLTYPRAEIELPGLQLQLELELTFALSMLDDHAESSAATDLWATVLANFKN